jgi:hypothetical protein
MAAQFTRMALDCVGFAAQGRHIADYTDFCKLQLGPGTAYYDRIRVKDQLIDEGIIRVENNRLHLGTLSDVSWLRSSLNNGDPEAWSICEAFPKRKLKFDPDDSVLRDLGLRGEEYVIDCLRAELPIDKHSRIVHLSLEDDSAGYDIRTPSTQASDEQNLLEVKTSSRAGNTFRFFLSRNEFETGKRNPQWRLILVSAKNGTFGIAGVLRVEDITNLMPVDTSVEATWASVRLNLNVDSWSSQLP